MPVPGTLGIARSMVAKMTPATGDQKANHQNQRAYASDAFVHKCNRSVKPAMRMANAP